MAVVGHRAAAAVPGAWDAGRLCVSSLSKVPGSQTCPGNLAVAFDCQASRTWMRLHSGACPAVQPGTGLLRAASTLGTCCGCQTWVARCTWNRLTLDCSSEDREGPAGYKVSSQAGLKLPDPGQGKGLHLAGPGRTGLPHSVCSLLHKGVFFNSFYSVSSMISSNNVNHRIP